MDKYPVIVDNRVTRLVSDTKGVQRRHVAKRRADDACMHATDANKYKQ